jgi:hypothetical protein
MNRRRVLSFFASLPAWWSARVVFGAENTPSGGLPNIESPTFGGLQYWADEAVCHGYRIQRNCTTGHYRLLNPNEERLAWGTCDQCRSKLDEVKREAQLGPMPKSVVLTLHGMARTRHSMSDVATAVQNQAQSIVYQLGYPSTRESIPMAARGLDRIVRSLEGVEEIDIVAYSMGCLVTRHWLGDVQAENDPSITRPKLRRFVMLGPPNNGATRANLWNDSPVGREMFKLVMGTGGLQLGPQFAEIKDRLAVPLCEFGIIAGGKGDDAGWHGDIPGDDDGTVGVDETKLAGATDFAIVPVRHTWLITDKKVLDMTCTFLEHGYFRTAAERTPLPR